MAFPGAADDGIAKPKKIAGKPEDWKVTGAMDPERLKGISGFKASALKLLIQAIRDERVECRLRFVRYTGKKSGESYIDDLSRYISNLDLPCRANEVDRSRNMYSVFPQRRRHTSTRTTHVPQGTHDRLGHLLLDDTSDREDYHASLGSESASEDPDGRSEDSDPAFHTVCVSPLLNPQRHLRPVEDRCRRQEGLPEGVPSSCAQIQVHPSFATLTRRIDPYLQST